MSSLFSLLAVRHRHRCAEQELHDTERPCHAKVRCYSRAQARRFISQGKRIVNMSYGIDSVVGTLFTWPAATTICSLK